MQRSSAERTVVLLTALVLVATAVAVLWTVGVTAYHPGGRTRCGPALQEWRNLFDDVAGRCHLARQDRLRLGLAVGGAMLAVTMAAGGVWWLVHRGVKQGKER